MKGYVPKMETCLDGWEGIGLISGSLNLKLCFPAINIIQKS